MADQNSEAPTNPQRKRELSPDLQNEAAALSELIKAFNANPPESGKISVAKAADILGISASGLHHYLKGVNPLNLHIAMRLANLYGFQVSSFSPRLAEEMLLLLSLCSMDENKSIPTSVFGSWLSLNEKLVLLPLTNLPEIPQLLNEIETERKTVHAAIRHHMLAV